MRNAGMVILVIVLLTSFSAPVSVFAAQKNSTIKHDESLRRGETRATLDPNLFQDPRVRQAYRVAKEIPWVLDSIYCFCYCEESFGHKSVLSCYVDTHASE
jgi:Protein of unknown function with PCYCGC motif